MSIDLVDDRRRRGRRARALPHLVRATSPATWRSSPTTSRTWRPCTRSSRCARGRPSSSAAATRCRAGASRSRSEGADAVIAVSEGMRRDVLECLPGARPRARAGDLQRHRRRASTRPIRGTDVLERYGVDPDAAVGRVRRADHAPEGRAVPASTRRCEFDPAAQLVLCAGAPDTPEIAAEVRAAASSGCGPSAGT